MTLILAALDKIWGDRLITSDSGERCDPIRKVAGNEWLVAGFAGDFETILEAIKLVESGESDPKAIASLGVEGLVIKDGRVLLLDTRRVWKRPKKEAYYAVGTGAATAMAFLAGRVSRSAKGKLREKDISDAFKYTAKCRTDCCSKFDYLEAWDTVK